MSSIKAIYKHCKMCQCPMSKLAAPTFVDHNYLTQKWGKGCTKYMDPNFLRCTKVLSQCHLFLSFLPNPFLPCKDTFMDDHDGIYNCNGLKYSPSQNFDKFWLIILYGDQNIG